MFAERLAAIPLLVLFLVLAGSLAQRLLPSTEIHRTTLANSAERLRALWERVLLGCGLLVALLFAAAATGLYQRPVLVGLTAAIAVLGGLALGDELRSRPTLSMSAANHQPNRMRWLLLPAAMALTFLLACLWLQSIRPHLSHDADVYHLTLPKLFLGHGGFFSVPLNVYSHWPLATELLFGQAMAVHDYVLAKQLHFVFGLLVLLVLLGSMQPRHQVSQPNSSAKHRLLTWPGLLAVTLFLANPVVLFEMGTAYIDLALAFFFLTAFLTADRLLRDAEASDAEEKDRRPQLLLLGIASGLVCATKLSGVFAAASILLVYWTASSRQRTVRQTIKEARWIVLPILVFAAPWPIKSWWLTGNPTYPLFFDVFGGPDWSKVLSTQHAAWQSSIGMGRSLVDYLLLPLRVITEGAQGYDHFDGRLHLAWLLFIPLSIWSSFKDPTQRRVLYTGVLYGITWAATSQQARLLIPLLALLAFSGGRALLGSQTLDSSGVSDVSDVSDDNPPPSRARNAAVITATLVMIGLCFAGASTALRQSKGLASDLVSLGYRAKEAVIHPVYHAIAELPPNSQLLLLNTNLGFFIDRAYQADSFFEASQIQHLFAATSSVQEAQKLLEQRNITHILYQRRQPGFPYPRALLALLEDPTRARLAYASPDERYAILELTPSAQ